MVNILGSKVFAEYLGTFILAGSIEFMTRYDQDMQSNLIFAILAGFFIAITLTREISGGHINPGVTVTVFLAEQKEKEKNEQANIMWTYIVAQTAGALTAVFLGQLLYNENSFRLAPSPGTYASEAFILEVLGSALFYGTILVQGDRDSKLTGDKSLSTLMITSGLAGGIALSGNISGGGVNPALGFAFNFGRLLSTGKIEECKYLWIYIVGPICGAFLASHFYLNFYRRYFELEKEEEKKEYKLLDD
jgi:glycerol uptake facilitator-like aquaporin